MKKLLFALVLAACAVSCTTKENYENTRKAITEWAEKRESI